MKKAVIIPSYKAADTLPSVIDRLPEEFAASGGRAYIINDCSPDQTASAANELADARRERSQHGESLASAAKASLEQCRAEKARVEAALGAAVDAKAALEEDLRAARQAARVAQASEKAAVAQAEGAEARASSLRQALSHGEDASRGGLSRPGRSRGGLCRLGRRRGGLCRPGRSRHGLGRHLVHSGVVFR